MSLKNKVFLFLLLIVSTKLFAQTKEVLKNQKTKIEEEINYTSELLSKTKKNKTTSLNYIKVLDKQIGSKEKLLKMLDLEIRLLNKQINKAHKKIKQTEKSIQAEENNMHMLKKEYAKMIYSANKNKANKNDLFFIISASDFNQAYKRVIYLKQYTQARKRQSEKIEESRNDLAKKKEKLSQERIQLAYEKENKTTTISVEEKEINQTTKKKTERQQLIKKLTKSEKIFKKQIQEKQKIAKQLEDKIRKLIEEEIKKARKEAAKKGEGYELTPEAIALSKEFTNNKGRLPWPVEKGVIVQDYGKQKHKVFSEVETHNNGIDIATHKGSYIRSVFDGTVSRIFYIKGNGKAVLINHGDYFSVYSGLKTVDVKVGEKVLSKEKIGIVLTEENDQKTELHFEIWKAYDKQDPSKWLYQAY